MRELPTSPGAAAEDIAALATGTSCAVLAPGDEGYAEESATFNLAVSHRPDVVVGARAAGDVQAAVRFAAAHDLPVAVLSTGHQASVPISGGVLITTRRMAAVAVDPARGTARIEAGVRIGQLVEEAAKHGLAPLNGSSGTVGTMGYLLGGGLSPTIGRAYGWAADYITAIDVVTADGELRHASATSEPDLFWALRGGKGNFGVVTGLELALQPVTKLHAGGLFFAGEHVEEVLHAYREFAAAAPDEMSSSVALWRLPDLPTVPEFLRGKFTVHVRISYCGEGSACDRLIAPLRAAAPVLNDTVAEMPYTEFASIHADPVDPSPFMEHSLMLTELATETVDTLLELGGAGAACPINLIEIRHLGGALSRRHGTDNAVGNRDAAFLVFLLSVGPPEALDKPKASALELLDRLQPWNTGQKYLNYMATEDVAVDQVRSAYDEPTYRRLQEIKAEHDPRNTFRLNHNIPPHTGR